jgi:hypothetical protein
MPIDTPDIGTVTDDFSGGLQGAQSKYEREAGNVSTQEQIDATAAASATWEDAIQDVLGDGTWLTGVRNPSRDWNSRVQAVGGRRLTQDTDGAADSFRSNFQPFLDEIGSLDLDPRAPAGDPANYDRSRAVGEALHQLKQNQG